MVAKLSENQQCHDQGPKMAQTLGSDRQFLRVGVPGPSLLGQNPEVLRPGGPGVRCQNEPKGNETGTKMRQNETNKIERPLTGRGNITNFV